MQTDEAQIKAEERSEVTDTELSGAIQELARRARDRAMADAVGTFPGPRADQPSSRFAFVGILKRLFGTQ